MSGQGRKGPDGPPTSDGRCGARVEPMSGLTLAERDRLRQALRSLPDADPPRRVWYRIEARARTEGLFARRRRAAWLRRSAIGTGLAAGVLLAMFVVPGFEGAGEPERFPTQPEWADAASPLQLATLNALMVESRQLEEDLRALPGEPRVARAGTAATIAAVEDQIGAIDYRLNQAGEMPPEDVEVYWQERVRLMNLLLQLRSAQARRAVF